MTKFLVYSIAIIIMAIVIGAVILYSAFSWGFLFYKLWYWFVLPVFPQLPAITYHEACGLYLFISGVFHSHNSTLIKKEYKDERTEVYTIMLLRPWIFLLFAWFISLFI